LPVSIDLRALDRKDLGEVRGLLAAFPGLAKVAAEKVFGSAPGREPEQGELKAVSYGAFADDDLLGLVTASGEWIRILAVKDSARGRGIGTVLLAAAESVISAAGIAYARTLDQPGNYLAPGIDAEDEDTIEWLTRRGYERCGENTNLEIDVADNPRVSTARAQELADRARARGYVIRRAAREDMLLLRHEITRAFSPAWAFEVERALGFDPPGVHLALCKSDGALAAFAVHDGNNQGLGWFGPGGTFAEHRKRGLGAALLLQCLVDVAAAGLPICTVAWIGPRGFYERAAGVAAERHFVVMRKDLGAE
jgi:GNAT superfamily N-acetyltransferase